MGQAGQRDRKMHSAATPTTAPKQQRKTASELLAEKMGELVDQAASRMDDKEFGAAEKKTNELISRVRASRRGTK
jgi:hypothetical protein